MLWGPLGVERNVTEILARETIELMPIVTIAIKVIEKLKEYELYIKIKIGIKNKKN